MSDIVERLRNPAYVITEPSIGRPELHEVKVCADMNEAADEIELLRAKIVLLHQIAGKASVEGYTFSDIKKEIRK